MSGVNVDNLIRQAGDNGWDFFDQLAAGPGDGRAPMLDPAVAAKAAKLAHVWAGFYATPAGREAIDHLVEITLGRASFTAMLGLEMTAAYGHGVFREGQNAIVFTLLKMIAEGRKEQQPTERTQAT